MKYITKDEMYNWMPTKHKDIADAIIPDDLAAQLDVAIHSYHQICIKIHQYLSENPNAEIINEQY